MNVNVAVEPELCFKKIYQEEIEVNAEQHQGTNHFRDIQGQVNIDSYKGILCYEFQRYGKFSNQFPYKQPKAINISTIGVMLIQNGNVINSTQIILVTCYTYSMTNNLDYVEDMKICAKHKELTVLTNGVSLLFDWKWRLKFYL